MQKPAHILIVDEDLATKRLLGRYLTDQGYPRVAGFGSTDDEGGAARRRGQLDCSRRPAAGRIWTRCLPGSPSRRGRHTGDHSHGAEGRCGSDHRPRDWPGRLFGQAVQPPQTARPYSRRAPRLADPGDPAFRGARTPVPCFSAPRSEAPGCSPPGLDGRTEA
jgi:hypothetical protein